MNPFCVPHIAASNTIGTPMGLLPLQGLPYKLTDHPTLQSHISAHSSMLHCHLSMTRFASGIPLQIKALNRLRALASLIPQKLLTRVARLRLESQVRFRLQRCHFLLRSELSTRGWAVHTTTYVIMYGLTRLSDLPGRSLLRISALIPPAETCNTCA